WEWVKGSNPYYLAYAPYSDPGKVGVGMYLGFLAACLFVSGVLVGLGTRRIRAVVLRQAARPAAWPRFHFGWFVTRFSRPRWLPFLPGPSLDGNPVLWREWHRARASRMIRAVWLLYAALGLFWTVLAARVARPPNINIEVFGFLNMFMVGTGLLLLSVGASI